MAAEDQSAQRLLFALLLVVLAVQCAAAVRHAKTKLVPKYYNVRMCEDKPNPLVLLNITYFMDKDGGEVVEAWAYNGSPSKIMKTLTIIIHRCSGGTAPNQCEYFTRWSWSTAICQLAVAKGVLWTPFVESVSPPFKCPVNAGYIHVRNASLDLDTFDKFAGPQSRPEKFIWPVEIQLWNERDSLLLCLKGVVEPRRIMYKN